MVHLNYIGDQQWTQGCELCFRLRVNDALCLGKQRQRRNDLLPSDRFFSLAQPFSNKLLLNL